MAVYGFSKGAVERIRQVVRTVENWTDDLRPGRPQRETLGPLRFAKVVEVTSPTEGKIRLLDWSADENKYTQQGTIRDAIAVATGMPAIGSIALVRALGTSQGIKWEILGRPESCFFAKVEQVGMTPEPPFRYRYGFVEVELRNGAWTQKEGGRQGTAFNGLEINGVYQAGYTLAPIDNHTVVVMWEVAGAGSNEHWFAVANRIEIPEQRWGGEVFTLDPNGAPYLSGTTLVIPRRDLDFEEGFLVREAETQAALVDLTGIALPEGGLTGVYGPFLYNAPYVQNGKLYFPTVYVTFLRGCVTAITAGETIEVELP